MAFNKKDLLALKTKKKMYRVKDDQIPALHLAVYPSGIKSFVLIKRPRGGKPLTISLGRFPDITIFEARQLANDKLSDIAKGNLVTNKVLAITFEQAFEIYLSKKTLAQTTIEDYKKAFRVDLHSFSDRSLASIMPEEILSLYEERSAHSYARANNAMRVFRAVYNYIRDTTFDEKRNKILPANPVLILNTTKSWKKVKRKKSLIRASDLGKWFETLETMPYAYGSAFSPVYYRYIRFMLFTGLRGDELRKVCVNKKIYLKQKDTAKGYFDSRAELLYFYDQKNHEEIEIPLSSYALDSIKIEDAIWLFDIDKKPVNYDVVKTAFRWISKESGVYATGHDLRRTFLTIAESLDISPFTYKALVGHKVNDSRDITAGYLNPANDRKRKAAQAIGDEIIKNL